MDKFKQEFLLQHINLNLSVRASLLKFVQRISDAHEEERRKLKYQEDLAKKIANVVEKINSVATEEAKIADEKKKVLQQNTSLNQKLKKETSKAEELQLTLDNNRKRMEEEHTMAKKIQDKVDILLKPYHDVMGVTFQVSKVPEPSLRIIFQMPNGKKSVLKMTQKGLKVVKCVPMIKDLDQLEAHLAETNDYPGFVTHLRSLFFQMMR